MINLGLIAERKIAKAILPIIKGEILKESFYRSPFDYICKDKNLTTVDVKSSRALGGWIFSTHKYADSFLLIGFNNNDNRARVVHIWMVDTIDILDIIESLRSVMPFHPRRTRKIKVLYKYTRIHIYDIRECIDIMSKYERPDVLGISNKILEDCLCGGHVPYLCGGYLPYI